MARQDFIARFLDYSEGTPSPEHFRLWSGIACVAGSLERRVYIETARSVLFPNLFTLLVGPPGVGKGQAIHPTAELWLAAKKLHIAPDNVTKAALVDALLMAQTTIPLASGIVEYHSLLVPSYEFGVLVPAHDLEFLNVLNYIFDNPRAYRENRRSLDKNVEIIHPQLNILGGTQPGFLASLLPEEAWAMGFTSRLIMIYASSGPSVSLFGNNADRSPEFGALAQEVIEFGKLHGKAIWEDAARDHMEAWAKAGCPPQPGHSKLQHYAARRILHTLKLSLISAVSRTGDITIALEDVQRAKDWLLGAEQLMPDIFREMVQKSDSTVIDELHFYMWQIWAKEKKGIHSSRIYHFLQNRVPSEKVARLIDVAEKSGIIERQAGTDQYIPKPKGMHGVE